MRFLLWYHHTTVTTTEANAAEYSKERRHEDDEPHTRPNTAARCLFKQPDEDRSNSDHENDETYDCEPHELKNVHGRDDLHDYR